MTAESYRRRMGRCAKVAYVAGHVHAAAFGIRSNGAEF
jgi:hypothetical protein